MKLISKSIVVIISSFLSASAIGADTDWNPDGPVKLILGYGAGGGHYALSQIVQERLSQELGQPIVVMPKPGAGGLIATEYVAKAKPDGLTITWSGPGVLTIWPLLRDIGYDPSALTPINLMVEMGYMLVTAPDNTELDSVESVIEKSQTDHLTYSSVGIGTSNSMSGHLLNSMSSAQLEEIGYKNGGEALMSTMKGETSLGFGDTASHELIKAGRLKAIATTTRDREPAFPDVPTISEYIPDYEVTNWLGVIAPPETPDNIVKRYQEVFAKVFAEPEIVEKVNQLGMTPNVGTAEDFTNLIKSEKIMWKNLIEDQKIELK